MNNDEMMILRGDEVCSLLSGQEKVLIEIVERAYSSS
jgi:hypothetical protein